MTVAIFVCQPIVEVASRRAIGWEVVLRPQGAAPKDYLRRAAEAGRGAAVDRAVVDAIGRQPLAGDSFLFINLSPHTVRAVASGIRRIDFPDHLARRVVWELPEAPGWPYHDAAVANLRRLLPGGRLALDDVGAGWADMERIAQVRPDFIKVARKLVAGIDKDPARQALVAGLVVVARRLDGTVIAEGVEREEEATALLKLGVPLAQGYLFGRPAPIGAPFLLPY